MYSIAPRTVRIMVRPVGRGISNAASLPGSDYCPAGESVAPTTDLHGCYPPSTVAPTCMVNELRDQYDPKLVDDVLGVKVFLVDDHQLLIANFRDVLKNYGINVAEVVYSLDGLIGRFLEVEPDVLMIDMCFDNKGCGENGLDAYEELLARDPSVKIIVLSQSNDQYIIERSYKFGVLVFARKDESVEMFNEATNAIAQDEEYPFPEIAHLLARSAVKDRNPSRLLDRNEVRAFSPTVDGAPVTEIATVMGSPAKTIGHSVKGVKARLGVESQVDITKLMIRHGITTTALKMRS